MVFAITSPAAPGVPKKKEALPRADGAGGLEDFSEREEVVLFWQVGGGDCAYVCHVHLPAVYSGHQVHRGAEFNVSYPNKHVFGDIAPWRQATHQQTRSRTSGRCLPPTGQPVLPRKVSVYYQRIVHEGNWGFPRGGGQLLQAVVWAFSAVFIACGTAGEFLRHRCLHIMKTLAKGLIKNAYVQLPVAHQLPTQSWVLQSDYRQLSSNCLNKFRIETRCVALVRSQLRKYAEVHGSHQQLLLAHNLHIHSRHTSHVS